MKEGGGTQDTEYLSSLIEEGVGKGRRPDQETRVPAPSKPKPGALLALGTQKGKSFKLDMKLEFKK